MFRLLIVDDEATIVEGLHAVFTSDSSFDELDVLKAYSATEALEWLSEVKVDVVLTDVSMPGLNGIDLVSRMASEWPRCKAVLLSGHNDFSYAQQAIRSPNVVDYLLKTEGMDKIRETVTKAIRLVREELTTSHQRILMQEKMPRALSGLQRRLLKDTLREKRESMRLEQEVIDALQLKFKLNMPVLLAAFFVEDWRSYANPIDYSLVQYAIGNIAEELLDSKTIVKCTEYDEYSIACFIQPIGREWPIESWKKRLPRFVHGTLETFQEACLTYLKVPVSIAVIDGPVQWPEVSQTYSRLLMALLGGTGFTTEKWMMVSVQEEEEREREADRHELKKRSFYHLENLFRTILAGDRKEAENHFQSLCSVYPSEGPKEPFDKLQFLNVASKQMLAAYDQLRILYANGTDCTAVLNLDAQSSWAHLLTQLRLSVKRINEITLQETDVSSSHEESSIIVYVHQYIHSHLDGDLSLSKIAKVVSLNPSYLSRWYKKHTGIALSEYINKVRVDKAKELLRISELKIHEISNRLGFTDPHYFFRFFKKAEKCTPNEYRDRSKING
ncbi:response regulator [Paenibacillus sp. KS-LC4]|uniref:response regulator transcription factor n=1 Tax=Paenibacillus sp. KS-LC4 TaxID=2979727 RepID=UPI0030CC8E00